MKDKGITLVSLVVTIIVMLILAGISISLLLGNNGVINKAKEAVTEHRIAEAKEKLILAKPGALDISSGTITIDDYLEEIKDKGIVNESDIGNRTEKQADVTVDGKYVFRVTEKDGDIKIEYIGTATGPRIESLNLSNTADSISVEVTGVSLEGAKYTYYIKEGEDGTYREIDSNKTGKYTYTGLRENEKYYIKVEATNSEGQAVKEETRVLRTSIATGSIQFENMRWDNGTASVQMKTSEAYADCIIQYQVNDTTGVWQTGTSVTGLKYGDVVNAKLTWDNGTKEGGYSTFNVTDNIEPAVEVSVIGTTSNTITATANATDAESGMPSTPTYTFWIKKRTESNYIQKQNGGETSCTFTGLTQGITYDVKVTVKDKADNTGEGTANGTTKSVTAGTATGAITFSPVVWTNNKASVNISTNSNYQIQYQVNGYDEGGWITGTSVSELNHGDVVYARLWDGTNGGEHTSMNILMNDTTAPSATINLSATTSIPGESVTATVTHSDDLSGVDIASCKWIWDMNSTNYSTTASDWDSAETFSNNPEMITLTVPENADHGDKYYLHVLTVDNVGNKGTSMSTSLQVEQEIVQLVDVVEIGDYVGLNIPYKNTETFYNSYVSRGYTSSGPDGWRVLSKTGFGSSGCVTLISAGVPLSLKVLER